MHFRIEIGRLRIQVWRESKPDEQADEQPPGMIVDHPTPQVVYHPERVGFYQMPDETD